MTRTYEIRDAIHGFISINEWERAIIDHPVFQRLRRIRQLGWTDMVYPGAMHTRFEHSLGVMHLATRIFERVVQSRKDWLTSELSYNDAGLERDKVVVRLASLLHDVGHAPFSHVAEELMPDNPATGKRFRHEDYSAAAITLLMRDVIEDHPQNQNYQIKASEIADFLLGRANLGRRLLWRELVSSQLDADRADYLLRDSHHIGVAHGRYDLDRLLVSITVAMDEETGAATLAVDAGGMHAAEGLILARYMMFTQVYFQHTRRAYDAHLAAAIGRILAEERGGADPEARGVFPAPTGQAELECYLAWTDWRVLGSLQSGGGGEHGKCLLERDHYRRVYETPEVPSLEDLEDADEIEQRLQSLNPVVDAAESSWYKFGDEDVKILKRDGQQGERLLPLSELSSVVRGLQPIAQRRMYVAARDRQQAERIVGEITSRRSGG